MIDVELQVIASALRATAEEMGAVLVRSAFSANIKERRDCSTALFDEAGRMVTQAEHIPVHLGAMPEAVAAVRAQSPAPGEAWILNDPFAGGTHLPDLTIVTRTALGFAVTRAHHADVGGLEPGSLPAGSRTLEDEGVVVPPTLLEEDTLESLVRRMRNPDERRGDLRAQLAAHRLAERRIEALCERRGRWRVAAAMDELLAYSERVVCAAIAELPDGCFEAVDYLETAGGEMANRNGDSRTFLTALEGASVIQVNWHWHLGSRSPNETAYRNVREVMEKTGRQWAVSEHMTLNGSDFRPQEALPILRAALKNGTGFGWEFVNVAPGSADAFSLYHDDAGETR